MLHTIRDLCIALDGLPLAIELVAALIKFHDPAVLQQRYLRMLMTSGRGMLDRPARQQSLQGALAWSLALLTPAEAALCSTLAVFTGPAPLPAIQAIAGLDQPEDGEALLYLLVEKSLVRMQPLPADEPGFGMLHVIRAALRAQPAYRAAQAEVEQRHAHYYLTWAEAAKVGLLSPDRGVWLGRVEAALPNLRQALAWARDQGEEVWLCRGVQALVNAWFLLGTTHEGLQWVRTVLAAEDRLTPAAAIYLTHAVGLFSYAQSDYAIAQNFYQRCIALQIKHGIIERLGPTYNNLGLVAWRQQRLPEAAALIQQALGIHQETNNVDGISDSLGNLGMLACEQEDWLTGERYLRESLAISRQQYHPYGTAVDLHNLGRMYLDQHRYPEAEQYLRESLALAEEHGFIDQRANAYASLGTLYIEQGQPDAARSALLHSLALRREMGDRHGMTDTILDLAAWEVAVGDPHVGVAWVSLAVRIYAQLGVALSLREQRYVDRCLDQARAALCPDAWDAAWAHGHALTLDGVVQAFPRHQADTALANA